MEDSVPPAIAKKLWHIVRVVYYMIRKEISKRKLTLDLRLLLERGKIAGKAIGNLMFHHRDNHHYGGGGGGNYYSSFSCRSMDPNLSYYNPREVEFSCSSTPSYPGPFKLSKRKRRHHYHHRYNYDDDVAAVEKAFEILNTQIPDSPDVSAPSPAPFWNFGKSPMVARQLRITDSPFPISDEKSDVDCHVDREAEEFIQKFYNQLRMQQRMASSNESRYKGRSIYG